MAAYLIEHAGWRWAFVVFGAVGVVWAAGFWWWFRDDPAEHPSVNPAELEVIRAGAGEPPRHAGPIPWAAVLRNPGIGLLGLVIVCSSFNSYLYYSWFSTYLQDGRKLENVEAGWLSSLVLGGAAVGVLAGGVIADGILRSRSVVWGRRLLGGRAYLVAAACLFLAARTESPAALASLAAVSSLCVQLTLPTWWSRGHRAERPARRRPVRPAQHDGHRRGPGLAGIRRGLRRLARGPRLRRPRAVGPDV